MTLRTKPQQPRAMQRIDQLLTAARTAIAEHGRDAFTTQHVAENAGTSIGTVYRYFPDRIAILDTLFPNRIQGLADNEPHTPNPLADTIHLVISEHGCCGTFTTKALAEEHARRIGLEVNSDTVEELPLLSGPDMYLDMFDGIESLVAEANA